MSTEQEQLHSLLDLFAQEHPALAKAIEVPSIGITPAPVGVQVKVTQGTTTAASDLTFLGSRTG